MDKATKMLVQRSWAKVEPNAETAGALFYERLFQLDPSLRSLFTADVKEQGRKLMTMIGLAVRGLDDLNALLPLVKELGARHAGYGVRERHYDIVARALLDTLETGLGDGFTPAVKEAWIETYAALAAVMKQAAPAKA